MVVDNDRRNGSNTRATSPVRTAKTLMQFSVIQTNFQSKTLDTDAMCNACYAPRPAFTSRPECGRIDGNSTATNDLIIRHSMERCHYILYRRISNSFMSLVVSSVS